MPVQLQGGLEHVTAWSALQKPVNDALQKHGLDEWTVTLRPRTAEDIRGNGTDDEIVSCWIDPSRPELMLAIDADRWPVSIATFVKTNIIDTILQEFE